MINKDAAFEDLHDRDDHGRFSMMSAALHAIEDVMGKATAHHASGSPDHDRPVMHVTAHEGGFALSAHDEDQGAFPFSSEISPDDFEGLREGMDSAADDARRGVNGQHYQSEDFSLHSHNGHVRIADLIAGDEIDLTPDEADQLGDAMRDTSATAANVAEPTYTSPLGDGEKYVRGSEAQSGGEFGVARAIVDTPSGRVVRVGLNGGEGRWGAGLGPSTAQLDEAQSRELADKLRQVRARGAEVLKDQDEAWRRYEASWVGSPEQVRLSELNSRRGKLDDELTPDEDAEWERLWAADEKAMADAGAIPAGEHVGPAAQVVTSHGTITLRPRIWEESADIAVSVHPNGQDPATWKNSAGSIVEGDISAGQASAMAKWIEDAWKVDGGKIVKGVIRRVDKSASGGKKGSWEWQWKVGKLRKKWVGSPHPWTALYRHLRHHMPAGLAKRTAAQWHKDVFGIWPGEKRGKNPVGPG